MKKKKLKKKIKELTKELNDYDDRFCRIEYDIRNLFPRTDQLKDAITKLENDNKYYKEWMDRSGVDYKSWFNFEEE